MDWRQLRVVVGSEMLEFEATEYDRQPKSGDSARGGFHASPRGEQIPHFHNRPSMTSLSTSAGHPDTPTSYPYACR